MTELTAEILRAYLHYDRQTGVFTRKAATTNAVKVGDVAGSSDGLYIKIRLLRKRYYAHRLAWLYVHGEWPAGEIDHANADKMDNRIENLREASRAQNSSNKPALANSKSGVKGVCWYKGKWKAQIQHEGRTYPLGAFDTIEKAKQAYDERAKQLHRDFARF